MFWPTAAAARASSAPALEHVTVAVGNPDECDTAVGERDPHRAADALLDAGSSWPWSSRARRACSPRTTDELVEVPPIAGRRGQRAGRRRRASAARSATGLLAGWPLEPMIRFANAAGAIVASRLECSTAMPTTAEVRGRAARRPSVPERRPCDVDRLRELRGAAAPRRRSRQAAAARPRAARCCAAGGRLMLVAADHPARNAFGVRGDADGDGRPERAAGAAGVALSRPGVDGVLGTADMLEDLLLWARWRARSSSAR